MLKTVHIIPLKNHVGMPGVPVQMNVFEGRFHRVINDCLENGNLVSILPPGDADYPGRKAAAGTVEIVDRRRDGSVDVILFNQFEIRLAEKAGVLEFSFQEAKALGCEDCADVELLREIMAHKFGAAHARAKAESVVNLCAYSLLSSPWQKMEVLEQNTIEGKASLVVDFMVPGKIQLPGYSSSICG